MGTCHPARVIPLHTPDGRDCENPEMEQSKPQHWSESHEGAAGGIMVLIPSKWNVAITGKCEEDIRYLVCLRIDGAIWRHV